MKITQIVREYQEEIADKELKQLIVKRLQAEQDRDLLDKIYTVLNKNNITSRFGEVLPEVLKDEYAVAEIRRIAAKIADSNLSYPQKLKFLENLENNRVINAKLLITPGSYTIDQLTYGDPINRAVFEHLKSYGVGQKMKGPAEHALAILSSDISIQGKGDVTVGDTPVEVKAATSEKKGGGGGRFGETGQLPSRSRMVQILSGFEKLAAPVAEFLNKQKSMNVETFVQLVNSVEGITPADRKEIGEAVFGEIFGNSASRSIQEFSKNNADPNLVRKAYIKDNFDWYKNSDMGGEWQVLAAISFADNAMGVIKNADDLEQIQVFRKNPAIITTDKPQEMLFQFNPKN